MTALQPNPVAIVQSTPKVDAPQPTPKMSLQQAVGASLRAYRTKLGLSGRQASIKAGVSVGHLCEIERGEKHPGSETFRAICHSLGVAQAIIIRDAADRLELNELLQGETL